MSYRDDQATLETRRDDLLRRLNELEPRTRELEALTRERQAIEGELLAVQARLERASARRLPLLDDVRVASPCDASWDEMKGDERVRFCASCEKNVYDLSALTRTAAERLLAEHEGSLCVRLYRRADGTVLTADCPVGLRRVRMRRVRRAVAAAVGAGAMALIGASLYRSARPPVAVGTMAWSQGIESPVMGGTGAVPVLPPPVEPPRAAPPEPSTRPHTLGKIPRAPLPPSKKDKPTMGFL